jgi:Protein of unknown function (DUF2442)
MTPKITQVEARPGHMLHVGFENGESRLFDVTPYLDKGVFRELRDEAYFRRVRPVAGGVEWPHEQDLSADTLYVAGTPLPSSRSATPSSQHDRSHRSAARHAARVNRP